MTDAMTALEQAIFARLCALYTQRPNQRYPSRNEVHTVAETHDLARVIADIVRDPDVQALVDPEQVAVKTARLHAVREVVRAAVNLCDGTEGRGDDEPPVVDSGDWHALSQALYAADALIPENEYATAAYLVTLMIEEQGLPDQDQAALH